MPIPTIPRRHAATALALACMLPALSAIDADASGKARPVPLEMKQPAYAEPWTRYGDWPQASWKDYSTLAAKVSPPVEQPPALTGPIEGDPKKGAQLAFDRRRGGSCLACHVMGSNTPALPGNVGYDLSTYGLWGRDDQWIFNYIYDPRLVNPDSVMPPWGAHKVFTVDEIKDMVAFLKTLKEPANFKDPSDDPARRVVPVENRDNLDPFVNSAMDAVDKGKRLYAEAGPKGKSCLSCHSAPEKRFKSWAASMPKYEPRMKKVLNIEEFVTRHARATTGAEYPMQSPENLSLAIYLKYLANGQPYKVDTRSAGAKQAAERGKELMTRKIGQLNFACIDCHSPDKGANKWIRGQWLTESKGQTAHFPTWRTSRGEIWDLRKRFQWCNVAIRANELPPDASEYGDIELYLTALSNGSPVNAPGIRH